MNVELSASDERIIREKVDAKQYESPAAVISEALRALLEREAETARLRDEIRAKIERGYQQSLRGEGVDGEEFMAQLAAEIDACENSGRGA